MKDSYKIAITNTAVLMASMVLLFYMKGLWLYVVPLSTVLIITVHTTLSAARILGKAEKKRFARERTGEKAMEISPSGLFIIDGGGIILDLNLRAESWFYGGKEDICGKSIFRNADFDPRQGRRFKTIFFNDMATHFPAEIQVKPVQSGEDRLYAVYVDDLTETVREQDKLMRLASEDALTGLLNRRSFMMELKKEIERSSRTGINCTVALIDLDHFKNINDTYGHDFGDEVLKTFAFILRENCRQLDIICRYGGEEFVVLLPHTDPRSSLNYLERVRTQFAGHRYSCNIQPTFSCGVVSGEIKGDGSDVDRLLKEADNLLYKAKDKGRNRIEGADLERPKLICVS